jgi:diacylglycerol kinase (ATP)
MAVGEAGVKNRPFHKRLGFAITGIAEGWRNERSFRTHVLSAIAAIAALGILRPPHVWWAIIILTIMLVLSAELVNAAFEGLVDHLHPDIHPRIRVVKDMAAGAVLIAAIGSLVVAGLLAMEMLGI